MTQRSKEAAAQGYSVGEHLFLYCLCIDIAHSTIAGFSMGSQQRDKYFLEIIEQLGPYLIAFELGNAIVKFTGDGWLIMHPGVKAARKLFALAKTMCKKLQGDIEKRMSLPVGGIPAIRTSLFSGVDLLVAVPTGGGDTQRRLDWIGDSARLATRYNVCAEENGLVIDYSTYQAVYLDFCCELLDLSTLPEERRPKHINDEKVVPCYWVGELKEGLEERIREDPADYYQYYALYLNMIGEDSEADMVAGTIHSAVQAEIERGPKPFIDHVERVHVEELKSRLFNVLPATKPGSTRDTIVASLREIGYPLDVFAYTSLVSRAPDYDTALHWYEEMVEKGIVSNVVTYNTLVNKAPDYDTALQWYEEMVEKGIVPNVVTYSTLVNKAPDYDTVLQWYEEMVEKGIVPDVFTYNTLVNKAPDYDTALQWYEEMVEKGIVPDVFTYNTLVNKAPDYDTALQWYEEMVEKGIVPNVVTYSTLVNKAPDYDTVLQWYEEMVEKGIVPDVFTYNTLVNKAPDYDTALQWYEEMVEKGIVPDEVTHTTLVKKSRNFDQALALTERIKESKGFIGRGYFSALFKKDISHLTGIALLGIYHDLPYRYEVCLEPAIKTYLEAGKLEDALQICLFAPHLPTALRLYCSNPKQSEAWFRDNVAQDPKSSNGLYGLGICLYEIGRPLDAEPYLRKARKIAYAEARIEYIEHMLREIEKEKHG